MKQLGSTFAEVLVVRRSVSARRAALAGRLTWPVCVALLLLCAANVEGQEGGWSKVAPDDGATVTTGCGVGYSPGCVSLGWFPSPLAQYYEYCVLDTYFNINSAGLCDGQWVNVGTATYATVEGLEPGMRYYWQVRLRFIVSYLYANTGGGTNWVAWSFWTRPKCTTFSVTPASAAARASAGSQQVTVDGTLPANCLEGNWTAAGNGSWLSVSPTSGVAPAFATVSWTTNPGPNARTGTASLAGRAFVVTQSAPPPPFTDEPLAARTTVIKAIHIVELQTRISAVRSHYGLAVYPWDVLEAGWTPVRAVHVTQLRIALDGAYQAAGLALPYYTDTTLTPTMPVRVSHITDLRNAVKALEWRW